jgi:hypothetical protein
MYIEERKKKKKKKKKTDLPSDLIARSLELHLNGEIPSLIELSER